LTTDAAFIVSTPNGKFSSGAGNPFHFKEFSFEEFNLLLRSHFHEVEIFGQSLNQKAAGIYTSLLGILINRIKGILGIQLLLKDSMDG
jgi:hypothetical protein